MRNGNRTPSLFVTFEGIDGCGKSTQIHLLVESLRKQGIEPVLPREPGGTPMGNELRQILLDRKDLSLTPESELLLFLAARAQICREVIAPELKKGHLVICDRFMDSSVAYQGYGRGLGTDQVIEMNRFAVGGTVPDLTILLDAPLSVTRDRLSKRDVTESNRLDQESFEFMKKVREGFLKLAQSEPNRIKVVSTDCSPEETQKAIWVLVQEALEASAES